MILKIGENVLREGEGAGAAASGGQAGGNDEALKAAIEKARLEERHKLQETITKNDEAIKRLKAEAEDSKKSADETKAALDKANKALEEHTKALEALKASTTKEGGVDVTKLIDEVSAKVSASYEKTLGKQVEQLTAQLNKYELKQLIDTLVKDAGGPDKLVMELVHGNTREEIVASIEKAKAAYETIAARIKPRKGANDGGEGDEGEEAGVTENDDDSANSGAPGVDGSAGGSGSGGSGTGQKKDADLLRSVRNMTPEEYAANRKKILASVNTRYAGRNPLVVGR